MLFSSVESFEVSSSERKKYWLDEFHVSLNSLKAFEEKKLACMSNKQSSAKLQVQLLRTLGHEEALQKWTFLPYINRRKI
uniref:Membrane-bound transcription factor PTM chromo domain-containing protein n=1 Tax=Nelumbo nucifera TaxID=4432 RepID=A0A822ZI35_NELNU|nr:TPA_asm: hypothetical protein HUJ06_001551 [Nelumbo nucifera]